MSDAPTTAPGAALRHPAAGRGRARLPQEAPARSRRAQGAAGGHRRRRLGGHRPPHRRRPRAHAGAAQGGRANGHAGGDPAAGLAAALDDDRHRPPSGRARRAGLHGGPARRRPGAGGLRAAQGAGPVDALLLRRPQGGRRGMVGELARGAGARHHRERPGRAAARPSGARVRRRARLARERGPVPPGAARAARAGPVGAAPEVRAGQRGRAPGGDRRSAQRGHAFLRQPHRAPRRHPGRHVHLHDDDRAAAEGPAARLHGRVPRGRGQHLAPLRGRSRQRAPRDRTSLRGSGHRAGPDGGGGGARHLGDRLLGSRFPRAGCRLEGRPRAAGRPRHGLASTLWDRRRGRGPRARGHRRRLAHAGSAGDSSRAAGHERHAPRHRAHRPPRRRPAGGAGHDRPRGHRAAAPRARGPARRAPGLHPALHLGRRGERRLHGRHRRGRARALAGARATSAAAPAPWRCRTSASRCIAPASSTRPSGRCARRSSRSRRTWPPGSGSRARCTRAAARPKRCRPGARRCGCRRARRPRSSRPSRRPPPRA